MRQYHNIPPPSMPPATHAAHEVALLEVQTVLFGIRDRGGLIQDIETLQTGLGEVKGEIRRAKIRLVMFRWVALVSLFLVTILAPGDLAAKIKAALGAVKMLSGII